MIKGAIFDLDGTLLDSMHVWERAGADYLRANGFEPKDNLCDCLKKASLRQAACHFQEEYGLEKETDEIVKGIIAMVGKSYREDIPLKAGAMDFLRQLQEKGVAMCIATTTDEYLASAALKRCGVADCFSAIITCGAVGHSKEEPHVYREALRVLGSKKEETLVFEDALFAAKTAKADGFPVAAVYDGYEESQVELRALADYYLADFSEFESFWSLMET